MNEHVHESMRPFLNWFGQPQTAHLFTRVSTGCGLEDTTTSHCSCGWISRPVSQASDFQSTELANQEAQHKFSGVSVDAMREGGVL